MRIDKFLWSVRLFKTRSLATAAVRDGKVSVGGDAVKASREIKVGEKVAIRRGAITLGSRGDWPAKESGGPKLVDDYIIDATPKEELEKLEIIRMERRDTPSMKGRPTKKNRERMEEMDGVNASEYSVRRILPGGNVGDPRPGALARKQPDESCSLPVDRGRRGPAFRGRPQGQRGGHRHLHAPAA